MPLRMLAQRKRPPYRSGRCADGFHPSLYLLFAVSALWPIWLAPLGPRQRRSAGNFVSPCSQVGVFSRSLGSFPYIVDWRSGCRVSSVVGDSEMGQHRMTGIGANHQLAWFCRPKTLALELMDERRNTPLHSLEQMKMKADGLIRVLCVDDNFLVAEGLRLKLRMAGGFHGLGHLSDADALMERVQQDR